MSRKQSDKKVITVRLTEEEKQKLETCSDLCGLSQSEFIRQLCAGKTATGVLGTAECPLLSP